MKTKRKSYFRQKLKENCRNIKETWKDLNTDIGRKSKTTTINSLHVNSNTFTDPKDIAQKLNHHFSAIEDKIATEARKIMIILWGIKRQVITCHLSLNNRNHLNFNQLHRTKLLDVFLK